MEIDFLTIAEVFEIHNDQIARYGGEGGLRDAELLQSALAMPQSGLGGAYLHKDLFEMAAAYLFHLVKNHPFVDGNKRVGSVAAIVFLDMNGISLESDEDGLEDLVLAVVQNQADKALIAEFFRKIQRHET